MASANRFVRAEAWLDPRHRRGLAGERLALAYLTACGWSVEAHRFRVARHDLDLVVRRGAVVAFVEVKTRASDRCGDPAGAVTAAKRRTLARLAEIWRLRHGRRGDRYRFDLVTVRLGRQVRPAIHHLADAWRLDHGWVT